MDLGPHAAFIWTAYSITLVVVAGLIAWLMIDGRVQQRRLDELAARGVTRRSGPRSNGSRNKLQR
jgi:heme exporter protein D